MGGAAGILGDAQPNERQGQSKLRSVFLLKRTILSEPAIPTFMNHDHSHHPQASEKSCCHTKPEPDPQPKEKSKSCCDGGRGHPHSTPSPPPKNAYFCPMCPGVEADEPGSCPMCGCPLEENPAFKGDAPTTRQWTCPMHPEVVRDEPGDCPKCGMALEPMGGSGDDPENAELRDLTRRMWIGAALALPVFVVAMTHLIPGSADWHWMHEPWVRWIQFVLSTPVVAWCGAPFFARGWRSLFGGRWNMFTLIMLGVGAAYAFSVVALLAPKVFPESMRSEGPVPLYFEAAAVIVVLVLVGQVMELRARARTSSAIQGLLDLAPPTAIRIDDDGEEKEISLDEVAVGDRLQVKANSKMPVDGVIEEGHSTVDESMVTGESIPVEKQAGDSVTGGTLNGKGSLVIRAEKIGSDTLLSRIVHMVADAQRSRAPIQGLADRVAGWFAPAVVVCAVLTFAAWCRSFTASWVLSLMGSATAMSPSARSPRVTIMTVRALAWRSWI